MTSEVTGVPITVYGICRLRSIHLEGPGNGEGGSMDAQRSSQLWLRLYIPEWWRMLVSEGKSRNRSVLQMGTSKVVFWPPRSSPSSYQRGFPGHGEWRLHTVQTDLFNVAHFRAKTKTTQILTRELLFADDIALVAHSSEKRCRK